MSKKLKVKKELRLVPVRFERATTGVPDIGFPDIDSRGHVHKVPAVNGLAESKEIRGSVVGVSQEQSVTVKMVREDIDASAALFVTSSDKSIFTVEDPAADTKCADGKENNIKIKGAKFSGSAPKSAFLEIRFDAKDGPIISQLCVYVFPKLKVVLQPYSVTINDSAGAGGTAPGLNINTLMTQVNALWAPCGIECVIQPSQSFSVNLGQANQALFAELNTIINTQRENNAINIYVVEKLDNNTLGYGFSKAHHAIYGIAHPAVFLALKYSTVDRSTETYWCANDLAHELGHFFKLSHPSDGTGSGWERFDTWSMSLMMHNYNTTFRPAISQGIGDWPDFNDFGYGKNGSNPFRAGLISMKNVRTSAAAGADGQCSIARNHVAKGPSGLY